MNAKEAFVWAILDSSVLRYNFVDDGLREIVGFL